YRLWERNQASGTSEIVPPEHPSRKRDTRAGWVAAGTSAPLSKLVSRLSSQTTHVLVFNRSDSLRAPALAENHVDTWGPAGSARPGMRPAGARKAFYGDPSAATACAPIRRDEAWPATSGWPSWSDCSAKRSHAAAICIRTSRSSGPTVSSTINTHCAAL